MANNCLTQLKKVSKTRDDYLTDHIHFSFFKIDFAGEAFGKGESAFDVCCKRNRSAKKSTTTDDEIGMENAAYNTKE